MSRGSSTGDDEIFVIEANGSHVENEILRQPIFATDFSQYSFSPANRWQIIFPYILDEGGFRLYTEVELKRNFPKALRYLSLSQVELKKRKQYSKWYGFSAPKP